MQTPGSDIYPTRGSVKIRVLPTQDAGSISQACDVDFDIAAATGLRESTVVIYANEPGRSRGHKFADGNKHTPNVKTLDAISSNNDRIRSVNSSGPDQADRLARTGTVSLHGVHQEMSETSQASNSSLTQKNPEYVYAQYTNFGNLIQKEPGPLNDGDISENDDMPETLHSKGSQLSIRHASTRNESLAHTYVEDDTGHVNLDGFVPVEDCHESNDLESQDASFITRAPDQIEVYQFNPETPALPINPFKQKGSVLKGFELFGATQPSSVGQRFASPTSSRPSPDIYNGGLSPRRIASSPLARVHGGNIEIGSPFKTNASALLSESQENTTPSDPVEQGAVPVEHRLSSPPRATPLKSSRFPRSTYIPLKESQERRRKEQNHPDQNESDSDSDFEIKIRRNARRRAKEEDINKELSAVEIQRPSSSDKLRSSDSGLVEIPSTGRRARNVQVAYFNKEYGFGNTGADQDDPVITDSQIPTKTPTEIIKNSSPLGTGGPQRNEERISSQDSGATTQSPSLPAYDSENEGIPDLALNSEKIESSADPTDPDSPTQEQSLPLQKLSQSSRNLRTRAIKDPEPLSDSADGRVPETSPPDDRIRPLTEIASISFTEDIQLEHIPCLTQDSEYDNIIKSSGHTAPQIPAVPPKKVDTVMTVEQPAKHEENKQASSIGRNPVNNTLPPNAESKGHEQHIEGGNAARSRDKKRRRKSSSDLAESSKRLKIPEESASHSNFITSRAADPAIRALPTPTSEIKRLSGLVSSTLPTANIPGPKLIKQTSITRASPRRSSKRLSPDNISEKGERGSRSSRQGSAALGDPGYADQPAYEAPNIIAVPSQVRPKLPKGWSYTDEEPPTTASRSSMHTGSSRRHEEGIFSNMVFAVSYVKKAPEKDVVSNLISQQGGRLLEDGFEHLFESSSLPSAPMSSPIWTGESLILSASSKSVTFAALIADEHSRKAKYMQALALGVPCLSGRWISACADKGKILDWTPYLLCAGQSSFLGGSIRSRVLQPYFAADARFLTTYDRRTKMFDGKSILMVVGKSRDERRKVYVFLTGVLGPARLGQVVDLPQARKQLLDAEAEGHPWDLLYVDGDKNAGKKVIFESKSNTAGSETNRGGTKGPRKGKKARSPSSHSDGGTPKSIPIINDETIIQSLILGQLVEE